MMFYLKCWVPSLSGYTEISELTIEQLTVLSKYLLNQDNNGISKTINIIIQNNLRDKSIYDKFTKFDKWFVAIFLRAVSVSPIAYIQTKKADNVNCSVEYDILKLLTKLSELLIKDIPDLTVGELKFSFRCDHNLFSSDYPINHINNLTYNYNPISINMFKDILKNQKNLISIVKNHLYEYDNQYSSIFLIESGKNIQLQSVPLRITDDTLFTFLKAMFLPFCKSLYVRKYSLMKNIGLTPEYIDKITYLEGQIYLNNYYEEENKKLKKVK